LVGNFIYMYKNSIVYILLVTFTIQSKHLIHYIYTTLFILLSIIEAPASYFIANGGGQPSFFGSKPEPSMAKSTIIDYIKIIGLQLFG